MSYDKPSVLLYKSSCFYQNGVQIISIWRFHMIFCSSKNVHITYNISVTQQKIAKFSARTKTLNWKDLRLFPIENLFLCDLFCNKRDCTPSNCVNRLTGTLTKTKLNPHYFIKPLPFLIPKIECGFSLTLTTFTLRCWGSVLGKWWPLSFRSAVVPDNRALVYETNRVFVFRWPNFALFPTFSRTYCATWPCRAKLLLQFQRLCSIAPFSMSPMHSGRELFLKSVINKYCQRKKLIRLHTKICLPSKKENAMSRITSMECWHNFYYQLLTSHEVLLFTPALRF